MLTKEEKKFCWTEEFSVNVKEIDEQHQEFIRIANSLIDLADSEIFNKEEALIKTGQLGSYAFYHLEAEEEMFAKTGYPEADEHVRIHNMFREKVNEFMNQIRDDKSDKKILSKEMAIFAGSWLLNHILGIDKKYTKFFNEHGLK